MIDLPENELVLLAKAGDEDAQTALLERMEGACIRESRGCPDAAQAARIGVLSAIKKYRGKSKFSTFAFHYVRGSAAKERRRCAPKGAALGSQCLVAVSEGPEQSAVADELSRRTREAIAAVGLTPSERAIVELRLIGGKTMQQTAEALGISRQAVFQREAKLLKTLKRALRPLRAEL